MSTRGWYEIYVVDREVSRFELSMQFYRWGDAVPECAAYEHAQLETLLETLDGALPVGLVEDLLSHIGASRRYLPHSFSLGYYLFLLLRAEQEIQSPWLTRRWARLPKKERPDYQLGFQVGLESVRQGFESLSHPNPIIDRAHLSIAVGHLIRPWKAHCHKMTFLEWLQYITMVTDKRDMGHIAGSYQQVWDTNYIYRFFVHVPTRTQESQNVESITLQICDARGRDLKADPSRDSDLEDLDEEDLDWIKEEYQRRLELFEELGERYQRLDDVRRTHDLETSPFWKGEIPRDGYIGP